MIRRKSDWRGVSVFLSKQYNDRHALIFDSFSPYGSWEPTFYGFPRYYRGRSQKVSMKNIPYHAHKMVDLSHQPVVILFKWREYYLTPNSTYPILPAHNADVKIIDYTKLLKDPLLTCTEFTGFSVIQLKEKSPNLAAGSYAIIKRLLAHYPTGSWTVELHLAAGALACALKGDDWLYHMAQAEDMVSAKYRQRLKKIERFISSTITDVHNN